MTYTVLGSQIPHLSKETHKKTSMTVHLRLKCECSVVCLFISACTVNAVLSFAEHLHRTAIA